MHVDTLVVGAGISGLAYAAFAGPQANVLVLESSPRAGGLIRTIEQGALRFEDGPESLQGSTPAVGELMELARIRCHGVPVSKRFLAHRGQLHEVPSSPSDLAGTQVLSALGKARVLMEPTRAADKALDGSIADFAAHRFGNEVLDTFVDAFVSGIHAGDPGQLSLRACFAELPDMIQRHGSVFAAMKARAAQEASVPKNSRAPAIQRPVAGMQRLPDALARQLGNRLRLSTPVRALERSATGFVVATDNERFECNKLVLATPHRALLPLVEPTLPQVARALAAFPLQHETLAGLVSVWKRDQIGHALDGFGYLVPHKQGLRHLGTLFSSSIDPASSPADTVVLRTLSGGARRPDLGRASKAELLEIVLSEVAPLLSITGEPLSVWHSNWGAVMPRYDLQHPERVAALELALAGTPELEILGNHLRGIGIPALITAARNRARSGNAVR